MRIVPVLLALAGCLKPAAVPQAPTPVPVAVVAVLESFERPEVAPAPDEALTAFADQVRRRNLEPVAPDPAGWVEPFATLRVTEGRLARLGPPPVVLIEAAPRFSAQVNGRYRWTVETRVSLATADGDPTVRTFEVPVLLIYAHETEAQALVEASPVVAREVGRLLDGWIAGSAAP